jgi:hypothetical protein
MTPMGNEDPESAAAGPRCGGGTKFVDLGGQADVLGYPRDA